MLKWFLFSSLSPYLPQCFADPDFGFFQRRLLGKQKPTPRTQYCVQIVDDYLRELTGPAFIKAMFSSKAKEEVDSILAASLNAFGDLLTNVDWMDNATSQLAIDKVKHIQRLVGYPDQWQPEQYSSMNLDENAAFVENMLRAKLSRWANTVDLLKQPVDRRDGQNLWRQSMLIIRQYVEAIGGGFILDESVGFQSSNAITFPAGILQSPFFNAEYPISMNFGGIGFTMVHELVHGFDDKGVCDFNIS